MPTSHPLRLSLCLIVRNEEASLPACLESGRGLADETIVVDTGSTDGTVRTARKWGATVIETGWDDDFSRPRNLGLDRARGQWILVLDADETLGPLARDQVRLLAGRPPARAYRLVQVGVDSFGRPMRMEITRLFPNLPSVRFQFPIHEQVDPALNRAKIPIFGTPIEIAHAGYDSPPKAAAKRARYRAIVDAALARAPAPETELHLRYLSATNFFEEGAWRRAAEEFEACLALLSSPGMGLARFARIRAAESHLNAGDFERALVHLPGRPDPAEHPAALFFRARIATLQGRPAEARPWYEALLAAPSAPVVPPVDIAALKARAAAALRPSA